MDLTFLASAQGTTEPVASLHINASRDAEDADHAVRVRWSRAREDLGSQGASEATLAAMDAVVGQTEGVPGPHGQVVFAADGAVLNEAIVADPPQDYRARTGPLPDPLLYVYGNGGPRVPHVLALVDSLGGDLRTVHGDGRMVTQRVEGDDWPIHKVRQGAYHHNQMQRAVDNQVADNAGRVAGAVAEAARASGAEVVALAGEIAVRGEVRDRLPAWLETAAVDLESGSRAGGSTESPLQEELDQRLREHAERQVANIVAAFEQGRAHGSGVAEGLADVVAALQQGQVATVLWSVDTAVADRPMWIGPSGTQLALTEQELRDMGVADPVSERGGPALLRSAAAGAAALVLIPGASGGLGGSGGSSNAVELADGVGALLRSSESGAAGG